MVSTLSFGWTDYVMAGAFNLSTLFTNIMARAPANAFLPPPGVRCVPV